MNLLRIELAVVILGVLSAGVGGYGLGHARGVASVSVASAPVATITAPVAPFSSEPDCTQLGVRFTVEGHDAFAPATGERDRAGHKYRRGGDRSTWLHVMSDGPITVHGSGDFMATDTGLSQHPWLSIQVKGEEGSWQLVKDGRAMMDVTGSDADFIRGRFEADMARSPDGRAPGFGSPVTRVRGTFCLKSVPANPHDTAP